MAVRRGHTVNVKASVRATESKSIFLDIKQDSTVQVRFLPPASADGALFTKVVNHFKLVTDDTPPRGMAVACHDHFDDKPCYMCELSKVLKRNGDKHEKQIGDDIRPSARFYAQVLRAEKDQDGNLVYEGPYLIGLPKTAVEDINAILIDQDEQEIAFFCDIEAGQDIRITRTGTGFNTKYKAMPTGKQESLDSIFPDWEDKFIDNVLDAVGLNIISNTEMSEAAHRTFKDDLDWDEIDSSYSLPE